MSFSTFLVFYFFLYENFFSWFWPFSKVSDQKNISSDKKNTSDEKNNFSDEKNTSDRKNIFSDEKNIFSDGKNTIQIEISIDNKRKIIPANVNMSTLFE